MKNLNKLPLTIAQDILTALAEDVRFEYKGKSVISRGAYDFHHGELLVFDDFRLHVVR